MILKDKVGKIVVNKKNEQGTIIEVGDYIKVDFGDRTARYYLDSFIEGSLIFIDKTIQKEVDKEIKAAEIEKARMEEERQIAAAKAAEERAKEEIYKQRKKHPDENMVFKSQICDGGTLDFSNWFKAPCTDDMKRYHIEEDKHSTWCNRCSACKKKINNSATEQEVIDEYNNNALCYESKILLNHEVKAGWDTDEQGNLVRPRSWNLKDDHLVVLMTVEPNKEQQEAIIYSVFLSSQTTQAANRTEASTHAAGNCYIDLTIDEARQMKLWEYMPAVAGDNPTFWGSGLFRYITDDVAARILFDIVEIVKKRNNKEDTENAELFLKNYVASYRGDINNIPAKAGAIKNIADMFGKDYHVEYLSRTPILTYQEVEEQFGIKIAGFGRGINITDDSVVLISSMDKKDGQFVYHDHWTEDGDYIYSGEGKTGDQKLTKGNKAIVDAKKDEKTIFLFVKLSPSEYYFQGPVEFVDYTYDDDKDENGYIRKEYKFRLRKKS